jgi:hypothetical protein
MKSTLVITLFAILLTSPLLVSANNVEILGGEYLNVSNSFEKGALNQDMLNIESTVTVKLPDLNQWGSNWGNKVPFRTNVPHDVVAYGVKIEAYFPKF